MLMEALLLGALPGAFKFLAYFLTPLAALIAAYVYGRVNANRDTRLRDKEALSKKYDDLARSQDSINKLEAERHSQVEKIISSTNSPDDLQRMWEKGPWGQSAKNSSSDKKAD